MPFMPRGSGAFGVGCGDGDGGGGGADCCKEAWVWSRRWGFGKGKVDVREGRDGVLVERRDVEWGIADGR